MTMIYTVCPNPVLMNAIHANDQINVGRDTHTERNSNVRPSIKQG